MVCDEMTTSSFSVKDVVKKEVAPNSYTSRSVRFSAVPSVRVVERVDKASNQAYWYTANDYLLMKAYNSAIAKQMRQGIFFETNVDSCRGLEHRTKDGGNSRKQNKIHAMNCVLEEQDRQVRVGVYDLESIADLYSKAVAFSRERAFVLGLDDARVCAEDSGVDIDMEESLSEVSSVGSDTHLSDSESKTASPWAEKSNVSMSFGLRRPRMRQEARARPMQICPL